MAGSRARGGMFMAAFGTMWLVGGVLGEFPSMPWLAAVAVVAGVALFLIHWRALRAEPSAAPAENPGKRSGPNAIFVGSTSANGRRSPPRW